METIYHSCNDGDGPSWGRLTEGCQRCDELQAGSPPREWGGSTNIYNGRDQARDAARETMMRNRLRRQIADRIGGERMQGLQDDAMREAWAQVPE